MTEVVDYEVWSIVSGNMVAAFEREDEAKDWVKRQESPDEFEIVEDSYDDDNDGFDDSDYDDYDDDDDEDEDDEDDED